MLLSKLPILALALAAAPLVRATEPMTNQGLVALAEAGFGEQFLLDLVKARPGKFDTSVEGLVFLAQRGLSERLVRAVAGLTEDKTNAPEPEAAPATPAVRLRKVKQEVLVAEGGRVPAGSLLVVKDERLLRDRWYLVPVAAASGRPVHVSAAGGR
jgi:hypothetical protein